MFDIGFSELLLIAIVGLLVLGPERLPGAIRTTMLWVSRFRRQFDEIKKDIVEEIGVDDIRQTLHNEEIMSSLEKGKEALEQGKQDLNALEPALSKIELSTTEPQHSPETSNNSTSNNSVNDDARQQNDS